MAVLVPPGTSECRLLYAADAKAGYSGPLDSTHGPIRRYTAVFCAVAKRDNSTLGRGQTQQLFSLLSRNATALFWTVAKRDSSFLFCRETP